MNKSISNIYDGLTNAERAALAFRYLTDANELELRRVLSSVPVRTYVAPELAFRQRFDGLFNMAALFAIEHWRAHSRYLATGLSLHICLKKNDIDEVQLMLEANSIWQRRLVALDLAMIAVCEAHGIDPCVVRRVGGVEPFEPMAANLEPDAEYLAEMQMNLARLIACNN